MNICVVGAGYVGLVTGVGLAELGHKVSCVDVDKKKIDKLKRGIVPFYERDLERLVRKNLEVKNISFTTNLEEGLKDSLFVFIAVGTPSRESGEADLSQIIQVTENMAAFMQDYKIIVIKSTVPADAFQLIRKILTKKKREGIDFDLVSNPEFLREGEAVYDFFHPTRIVIGVDEGKEEVAEKLAELFRPLNAPIIKTSIINAQMIKYASNVFLASRISFINEIANICEKVGADVEEIVRGMSFDKRLGDGYLKPGIGFGGPCLIKDLKALIKIAETYGYEAQHLKSILAKNEHQVKHILLKVKKVLGDFLYGKTIGVLGLTFKSGTNDVRSSLALRIIDLLRKEGAQVKAYDPWGMEEAKLCLSDLNLCKDPYEVALGADMLLILTGWEEFKKIDFVRIKKILKEPIIVDGVNLLDPEKMRALGFMYKGVGR